MCAINDTTDDKWRKIKTMMGLKIYIYICVCVYYANYKLSLNYYFYVVYEPILVKP